MTFAGWFFFFLFAILLGIFLGKFATKLSKDAKSFQDEHMQYRMLQWSNSDIPQGWVVYMGSNDQKIPLIQATRKHTRWM